MSVRNRNQKDPSSSADATSAPNATKADTTSLDIGLSAFLSVCVTLAFFVPTETAVESGSDLLRVVLILVAGAVAFWFLGQAKDGNVSETLPDAAGWTWVDLCVLGFVVLHSVSCLFGVIGERCEPRPAINLLWQQLGFGVLYALARLTMQTCRAKQLLLLTVVAGGLMVGVYAWYQYWVELPGLHQAYLQASANEKIQMLIEAGVSDPSPGSRMRELFESRLFNREPFAYFTLANSLAGLMVPLVLLTFALFWNELIGRRWLKTLVWFLPWLALVSTLTLTSSRAGVLTVSILMAGIVAWNLLGRESSRKVGWGLAAVALVLPLVAVTVLWAVGASDGQLISSAPASLRYRLEYWYSSMNMVLDYPWFGCGPGSFQSCYAKYQLPTASETVSDPHNFLIEWLATAGVPVVFFALLAIVLVCKEILRSKPGSSTPVSTAAQSGGTPRIWPVVENTGWICGGSLVAASVLGITSGWLFGFQLTTPVVFLVGLGLASLWLVIAARSQAAISVNESRETNVIGQAVTFAWIGLMLHLSISGGINYPAIGQFFILLMALKVNDFQRSPSLEKSLPWINHLSKSAAIGCVVLAGYVYYFQLNPLVKASSLMSRLESSRQINNADALLRQVLKADPFHSEAAFQLATERLVSLLEDLGDPDVRQQSEEQIEIALRLEPYSSPARVALADRYLGLVDLEQRASGPRAEVIDYLLQRADYWLAAASQRKPIDTTLLARRSCLKWVTDQPQEALQLARQAAELDRVVPHVDLKLERTRFSMPLRSVQELVGMGLVIDTTSPSHSPSLINSGDWISWVEQHSGDAGVAPK